MTTMKTSWSILSHISTHDVSKFNERAEKILLTLNNEYFNINDVQKLQQYVNSVFSASGIQIIEKDNVWKKKHMLFFRSRVSQIRIIEFQIKKFLFYVFFIVVLFFYDFVCLSKRSKIANVFKKKLITTTTLIKQ